MLTFPEAINVLVQPETLEKIRRNAGVEQCVFPIEDHPVLSKNWQKPQGVQWLFPPNGLEKVISGQVNAPKHE